MKVVTFPLNNCVPAQTESFVVVGFLLEKLTLLVSWSGILQKIMEIVDDFVDIFYKNNNNRPWTSSIFSRMWKTIMEIFEHFAGKLKIYAFFISFF